MNRVVLLSAIISLTFCKHIWPGPEVCSKIKTENKITLKTSLWRWWKEHHSVRFNFNVYMHVLCFLSWSPAPSFRLSTLCWFNFIKFSVPLEKLLLRALLFKLVLLNFKIEFSWIFSSCTAVGGIWECFPQSQSSSSSLHVVQCVLIILWTEQMYEVLTIRHIYSEFIHLNLL